MSQFQIVYESRDLSSEDFGDLNNLLSDLYDLLEDALINLKDIPTDECGFLQGSFKLKLEWKPEA